MKHFSNLRNVGGQAIAPPSRSARAAFAVLFVLLCILRPSVSLAQTEPSFTDIQFQFQPGTTQFQDTGFASAVIANMIEHFKEHENEVLLVKIRTPKTEMPTDAGSNLHALQLERAAAIKNLFLGGDSIEIDQLQIHSSLAYGNTPATVNFEVHVQDDVVDRDSVDTRILIVKD